MLVTYPDPRFDPQRNALELGSVTLPSFFVDADAGAGPTDLSTTATPVWWDNLPWKRALLVLGVLWLIWRLGK